MFASGELGRRRGKLYGSFLSLVLYTIWLGWTSLARGMRQPNSGWTLCHLKPSTSFPSSPPIWFYFIFSVSWLSVEEITLTFFHCFNFLVFFFLSLSAEHQQPNIIKGSICSHFVRFLHWEEHSHFGSERETLSVREIQWERYGRFLLISPRCCGTYTCSMSTQPLLWLECFAFSTPVVRENDIKVSLGGATQRG